MVHRFITGVVVLLSIFIQAFGQNAFKQTIRGVVVDKNSQHPLAGVNVVLLNTSPLLGAATDLNGEFSIEKVDVGKYNIKVSLIGYHTATLQNLMLNSGKELIIRIEIDEQVITTEEIVVKAYSRKDQPINQLATVSARSFSVEETERYAGTWLDPARMASNYAGVMTMGDQRNDIIIRGNSPTGLLWRLDGINIPNPNHFGTLGTTGGPISILNNNLLDNSDFFTGAFPAEYGNALSGVFDLRMRTGNNQKHEYVGQVGLNGVEFGMEGPFSKNGKSSYLANYRYSTLQLFKALGISFGVSAQPQYQDLSFKFDFPSTKAGRFSIIGIGGRSFSEILSNNQKKTDWSFGHSNINVRFGSDMGVVGITHTYFFHADKPNSARLRTSIAVSGTQSTIKADSAMKNKDPFNYYGDQSYEIKYSGSTQFYKKINSKDNISAGINLDWYNVHYEDSILRKNYQFFKLSDTKGGNIALIQSFIQIQHKLSDNLILYGGIHYQHFTLNNHFAIEPRANFKWNFKNQHSLSLGIGVHNQLQPRLFYFLQTRQPDNTIVLTNRQLNFTQSNQVVICYDYLISSNLRIKVESYFQDLRKIPVESQPSTYSIINYGTEFYGERADSLVNNGKGKNYGLEFTFEHFLNTNYYYLFTTSLFNSKYTASDRIERNTVYNGNYVVNILGGYKIKISKYNSLSLDLKFVSAGGKRYIPVDLEKSKLARDKVLNYSAAYKDQFPDYFRLDARTSLKFNFAKFNVEFAFDVQNITDHKNIMLENYDTETNSIRNDYQLGLFWIALARVQF